MFIAGNSLLLFIGISWDCFVPGMDEVAEITSGISGRMPEMNGRKKTELTAKCRKAPTNIQ